MGVLEPARKATFENFWADNAFQLNGNQADFDKVIGVPLAERKAMFEQIQSGT